MKRLAAQRIHRMRRRLGEPESEQERGGEAGGVTAEEILSAAGILLGGGGAQPGAIFQAIDPREPGNDAVLGSSGAGRPPRRATVFFRQNRKSYRSVVNLTSGTFTTPVEIPRSEGQLGLTFQEIVDFAFVFQDPAFLHALARRGIVTPEELARVLVTPLTPGSFGLPEERRRIVKAQMYSTVGAGINLFAKPIEGVQAIVDLDERKVIQVIDTGVVPLATQSQNFDEASVLARVALRPALRPIRSRSPKARTSASRAASSTGRSGSSTCASSGGPAP